MFVATEPMKANALATIARWKATELERFWAKVRRGAPDVCWEWIACRDSNGYGRTRWRGRAKLAHRLALSLSDGIWDSTLHVCHTCDNPACCNPAHLWRGTQRDNLQDCKGKGRSVGRRIRGEASPQSKATEEVVLAIRKSDLSYRKLAALHGISATQARMIKKRAYWRHVQ